MRSVFTVSNHFFDADSVWPLVPRFVYLRLGSPLAHTSKVSLRKIIGHTKLLVITGTRFLEPILEEFCVHLRVVEAQRRCVKFANLL